MAEAEWGRADHRPRRVAVGKERNRGTGANPTVRAEKRVRCHVMLGRGIPRIVVDLQTVAIGNAEA
eukprot:2198102-Pyramimonas_sp.AAC.1